jgi:excinuclease ABC subunit C
LRSCSDAILKDYARRGRPCIEYEMKRCSAPCCGLVSDEDYAELVQGTELFLRGRSEHLMTTLRKKMEQAAEGERFEDAARLRDRIEAVERTVEQQQIVDERLVDRDVFGLARDGGEVELQVLRVRDGRVVGAADYEFSDVRLDDGDIMGSFLGQYYGGGAERPVPAEVLSGAEIDDGGALEALLAERAGRRVVVRTPKRGSRRELVGMAAKNAELGLARRLEARESIEAALAELHERLGLADLPRRIECYDVSNLQGALAVASRVVFEGGQAVKAAYRRYKIREAKGGDDLACMREVLERRLARIETEPLPDLLVVDGGKGQLGVATALLRDRGLEVDHLGIAKQRDEESPSPRVRRSGGLKAERIFLPGRKDAVRLVPSSRGLLLLQRVRDESHRFAIEYQRSLRRKVGLQSILEELPGIGPGKRRALLRRMGSLRSVRSASVQDLCEVPGISRRDAETIHDFFRAADGSALGEGGQGKKVPKRG